MHLKCIILINADEKKVIKAIKFIED